MKDFIQTPNNDSSFNPIYYKAYSILATVSRLWAIFPLGPFNHKTHCPQMQGGARSMEVSPCFVLFELLVIRPLISSIQ